MRAKRGASISGELCIRSRRVARSWPSGAGRRPTRRQSARIARASWATSSGRPTFDRMLRPPRPTAVCPGQAHHRHAHPQGIAGRGAAAVGKRVQGHVDLLGRVPKIVIAKEACPRMSPAPARRLARRKTPAPDRGGCRGGRAGSSRDSGTACSSRLQAASVGGVTLQKLFRQPKVTCGLPGRRAGRLTGGVSIDRPIAPVGLRQADRLLAVERVSSRRPAGPGTDRSGDSRSCPGPSCRSRPDTSPARGGLAGKDQQAVVGHVHGQVHQDVDPVLADRRRRPAHRTSRRTSRHTSAWARQRSVIASGTAPKRSRRFRNRCDRAIPTAAAGIVPPDGTRKSGET